MYDIKTLLIVAAVAFTGGLSVGGWAVYLFFKWVINKPYYPVTGI